MKKIITAFLVSAMLISLIGCNKDKKNDITDTSAKDSSAVESKINISDSSEVDSTEIGRAHV